MLGCSDIVFVMVHDDVEMPENFPSSSIKNVVQNALNSVARLGSDVSMIHFKKAIEKERQRLI